MKRCSLVPALLLAGCGGGFQSALDPGGSQAGNIARLWWLFLIILGVIFIIVVCLMLAPLLRHQSGPSAQSERALTRIVGGATGVTALILLGLIVISVSAGKAISLSSMPAGGIVVEVTASQWWWNIRYVNDDVHRIVVTANEMHVPVGRPVLIRGTSLDVIHSFWVPNLHGKRDLIPSRITTEWFEADRPGRFRGQCAEFCGFQHAHMAFWVVAEPEAEFEEWMNRQLQPAVEPSKPSEQRGQQVFLASSCILCHSIRGTPAAGLNAPDLTHLASRMTIAAGTLANNRGNLAGWITDPQAIKPGNHMATAPLRSEDVSPLLDYLESLK
jgi:cytochrome c oxidase subunit 2